MISKVFPGNGDNILELFLRCRHPDIAFWKDNNHYYLAPFPAKTHILWEPGRSARDQHLQTLHAALKTRRTVDSPDEKEQNRSVSTGIYGFFSYDLGRDLLDVAGRYDQKIPLSHWNEYDFVLFQKCDLSGPVRTSSRLGRMPEDMELLFAKTVEPFRLQSKKLVFHPVFERARWQAGFKAAKEAIRAGEIYQLNLAKLFEADFTGNERHLFLEFLKNNPAQYAAFFGSSDYTVLSASPELFLRISDRKILTQPIKGTKPRGLTPKQDRLFRKQLLASPKEKAELMMITDLMRNDLAKSCQTGSVHALARRKLRALPTVWHTFSEVSGKLKDEKDHLDAILACLPCGSIAGCPKKRAVEIIEGLEPHSRGLFCGTMGYFADNGRTTLTVLIRTFLRYHGRLYYQAGGGITVDSLQNAEEEEIAAKCSAFFLPPR